MSDDIFIILHIFQTRHSISAYYDGRGLGGISVLFPVSKQSQRPQEIFVLQIHMRYVFVTEPLEPSWISLGEENILVPKAQVTDGSVTLLWPTHFSGLKLIGRVLD